MLLEDEFTSALESTVVEARKAGYPPNIFHQMLQEFGGVQTAKRLILEEKPQTGLFRLYELDLLDISMEAVMLQERFKPLFTPVELEIAHRRLCELQYFK